MCAPVYVYLYSSVQFGYTYLFLVQKKVEEGAANICQGDKDKKRKNPKLLFCIA